MERGIFLGIVQEAKGGPHKERIEVYNCPGRSNRLQTEDRRKGGRNNMSILHIIGSLLNASKKKIFEE